MTSSTNMSIELKTENLNWTSLVGVTLGDSYLLERLTSAEERFACFVTQTGGERSSIASLKLLKADGDEAERQLQIWQMVKMWEHPNLLPIWGTGRAQVEGRDLIYSVTQMADEDLAGVLGARGLEPAEAGEVLVGMVGALGHLHVHRLIHGNVSPQQILAVGEAVKLATERVRRMESPTAAESDAPRYLAPESAEANVTPAADVWCLGMTLLEALTRTACRENCAEAAAGLPSPFREVVESCLRSEPETRATLTQVLALYEGGKAPAEDAAPPVMKQMAAAVGGASALANGGGRTIVQPEAMPLTIAPTSSTSSPSTRTAPPMSIASPHFMASHEVPAPANLGPSAKISPTVAPRDEPIARAKRRAWILVAIAFAILLGVVWLLRPAPAVRHVGANRSAQVPTSQLAVKDKANHGQTMTLPAMGQDGAPASMSTAKAAPAQNDTASAQTTEQKRPAAPAASAKNTQTSVATSGPIWRVVLYSYNRAADAEGRAARINERHGGWNAELFTPNGSGNAPFLVVIGGAMDYRHAAELRKKAIHSGLPRDAYLRNYNR